MEFESFTFIRIIIFTLASIPLINFSWKPLHNIHSHGFYRFFAFEGILILVLMNISYWYKEPLSPLQFLSWIFLLLSILFVYKSFSLLRKSGGFIKRKKINPENFDFENTIKLITEGLYKYIRHPMYSSLLLLAWGAFLKHLTIYGWVVVLITTALLVATAKLEERENISFFGSSYEVYIQKTKMFIPYLF